MQAKVQQWISITGRLFGTLFYYEPTTPQAQAVLALFKQQDWYEQLDVVISPIVATRLTEQKDLSEQYQTLFIGPNTLFAPPWGSVYLDPESVIFGCSYLELRSFLRKHRIEFSLAEKREAEDHFGLMLMLSAYLAENKPELLNEYLSQHFLIWSSRYLQLLSEQTEQPFYQALSELTQQILQKWQEWLLLEIPRVQFYR
ncbi:Tat proofreading chaperone DmsD [Glaesserella sp.]|uniref:Tat proofreading chaperone DmsD n=1 Tax=Glaesserella sp. TaxID=2094731 RepID=UPI0035A0DDF0